jgi:pyruvate dehydrogenase E1 component beta subunit
MISVREALRKALALELRSNPKAFLLGEEVALYDGAYKVTKGFLQEFGPSRIIDTPISEQAFAGLAVGAAMRGLRPICEFMTWNFALQAIDQIVNSAAKTRYMSAGRIKVPVLFRGPNGAAAGVAAQHSQDFAAWYGSIPGLVVFAPWSAQDAFGAVRAAMAMNEGPSVLLENEILYPELHEESSLEGGEFILPIGKLKVEAEGCDWTVVAHSKAVSDALEAKKQLEQNHGIRITVLNLRTIQPLDIAGVVDSVRKTRGRLAIVEGGWQAFGVGAEISAALAGDERSFWLLDSPILRIGGPAVPMPYAENLERLALPSVERIVQEIVEASSK